MNCTLPDKNCLYSFACIRSFSATLPELQSMRSFIRESCHRCGFSAATFLTEIDLCAHEACANIVLHSYRNCTKEKPLIIHCASKDSGLSIILYDQGTSFVPKTPYTPYLEERGKGLFLIHTLAHHIEFSPKTHGSDWNRMRIFKKYRLLA